MISHAMGHGHGHVHDATFPTRDGECSSLVQVDHMVEEPGCGKSHTNNLPAPADLTENHYAKKILFLMLQIKNRSRWFEDGNIFKFYCNIIWKCCYRRDKGGILTQIRSQPESLDPYSDPYIDWYCADTVWVSAFWKKQKKTLDRTDPKKNRKTVCNNDVLRYLAGKKSQWAPTESGFSRLKFAETWYATAQLSWGKLWRVARARPAAIQLREVAYSRTAGISPYRGGSGPRMPGRGPGMAWSVP